MSFGSKAQPSGGPQPTFTPQASTAATTSTGSAAARDRLANATDPQSALLQPNPSNASDEERKRLMDGSGSVSGMY